MRLRQKHIPVDLSCSQSQGFWLSFPHFFPQTPNSFLSTLQNQAERFRTGDYLLGVALFGAILMKPLKISPRQELLLKQSAYMACSGLYDQEEKVWRFNSNIRHLHQPVTHSDKDQEWLLRWLNRNPVVNLTVASSHTCTHVRACTHTDTPHTHNTLFMNLKSQPLNFYLFFFLFQITHLSPCQSDPIWGFQGT